MKVHRRTGVQFIASLPVGFDERTRFVFFNHACGRSYGSVIATHPDHLPVIISLDTGEVVKIGTE